MTMLILSCASAGPATTKDAPVTEEPTPAGGGGDELSKAFEPEAEKTKPVIVRPVEAAPVDPALAFKAALADGQAALKSKQLDAARTAAKTAIKEALDGEMRMQAGQLSFKVELAAVDPSAAEDAATAWRLACGPEKVDACRNAALAALVSASKLKGADKKLLKKAKELQDAEVCAAKTERAAKDQPCEPTAKNLAVREHDPFLGQ